jgi:hypothetical protein
MAVLALAEAGGRQRRQLINAIVGAALGSSGYGIIHIKLISALVKHF